MKLEERKEFGATWFKVTNSCGFCVELCSRGASIYQMWLDGKSLLIAEKDPLKWFSSSGYFGKTIGRVAGRIRNGDLFFEGRHYPLSINGEGCTLHGGAKGFSFQDFDYEIHSKEDGLEIAFSLLSPNLDNGFPGEVRLKVRYLIAEKEPSFRIDYAAESDRDTPLSLTSHCYFNLGGYEDIGNHSLRLDSKESTKYDENQIPLGFERCPKALCFESLTPLAERLDHPSLMASKNKGIDHAFRIEGEQEEAVRLESPLFALSIKTDFPTVVVYADNYPRERNLLTTGYPEKRHSGLAIEPEYEVNDFASMTVKEGITKKNFIEYHFERK